MDIRVHGPYSQNSGLTIPVNRGREIHCCWVYVWAKGLNQQVRSATVKRPLYGQFRQQIGSEVIEPCKQFDHTNDRSVDNAVSTNPPAGTCVNDHSR